MHRRTRLSNELRRGWLTFGGAGTVSICGIFGTSILGGGIGGGGGANRLGLIGIGPGMPDGSCARAVDANARPARMALAITWRSLNRIRVNSQAADEATVGISASASLRTSPT